ncbi:extracellular solute-binding protein [Nonomuraea gerenzanensis]|uniref:Glycerol-3-phosphate ABC transporter, periplasmic glycerol-3-phosphate-binding protein (TC 3.A.1.1.3) n=1 Tax=Nonomuraea gerenzanensis TaxID=93944 RepID=A0A1M4EAD3_9ACTN|nr:extracellular solute-binding protein [Nonomuraea gerenzanensis]UBU18030.1 extracellular solute-binding protein [Nonomuraea gerenzanensis]SBO95835.1 Glycerol-3-phosphate ABC transporter, periplasmic glycerol-3-phosphate-binding protein (TC 3.A.1.1.3) [Nonomuraea gerenzanensis]
MTTVVNVWLAEHPLPGYLDPIKKLAAGFEAAHPGYRIDITGYGFRELPAEVARAAARGTPPDLAEYYATATRLALDTRGPSGAPLFVPVERAVAGRGEILGERVVLGDLEPAVRGYYTYAGELVAAPMTATTAVLLGNTAMLEAAGFTTMPRTWGELAEAGPVTWANHGWLIQQAVAGQGGLLADHDNGRSGRAEKVTLASEELLAYATWWQRLHRRGRYLDTGTPEDWGGTLRAFTEQRVACTVASSVVAGMIARSCAEAGFEVAAGPLPYNEGAARAGHLVSGQAFWLTDGLPREKADGALAFLQYLLDARNVAEWHRGAGFLPVTGASVELLEREGWFERHPIHRAATGQLRAADGSPAALGAILGDFAGIQDLMTGAMTGVLAGGDPGTRLAEATAAAQRLLDAYNDDCAAGRTPRRLAVK